MLWIKSACLAAGFMLLMGCQATPQADRLRQEGFVSLPPSHTIDTVPFSKQQQFYCGPTTLSEVFGYYGVDATPKDIAPKLFIPNKEGSLQLEMVSATRQYGFLPYTERGTLSTIMALVSDNIPIIVFQNLSIQILPQWHYAVVIGFNSQKGTVTLHTGVTENHEMSLELFERTWGRGNYWYMAPVPSSVSSNSMSAYTYVSAAYDMMKVGSTETAIQFLEAATKQWPSYWLSYFLLANHYLESEPTSDLSNEFDSNSSSNESGNIEIDGTKARHFNAKLKEHSEEKAIIWFKKGYEVGKHQQAYVHNYAYTLFSHGEFEHGVRILNEGLTQFPHNVQLLELAKQFNVELR